MGFRCLPLLLLALSHAASAAPAPLASAPLASAPLSSLASAVDALEAVSVGVTNASANASNASFIHPDALVGESPPPALRVMGSNVNIRYVRQNGNDGPYVTADPTWMTLKNKSLCGDAAQYTEPPHVAKEPGFQGCDECQLSWEQTPLGKRMCDRIGSWCALMKKAPPAWALSASDVVATRPEPSARSIRLHLEESEEMKALSTTTTAAPGTGAAARASAGTAVLDEIARRCADFEMQGKHKLKNRLANFQLDFDSCSLRGHALCQSLGACPQAPAWLDNVPTFASMCYPNVGTLNSVPSLRGQFSERGIVPSPIDLNNRKHTFVSYSVADNADAPGAGGVEVLQTMVGETVGVKTPSVGP